MQGIPKSTQSQAELYSKVGLKGLEMEVGEPLEQANLEDSEDDVIEQLSYSEDQA